MIYKYIATFLLFSISIISCPKKYNVNSAITDKPINISHFKKRNIENTYNFTDSNNNKYKLLILSTSKLTPYEQTNNENEIKKTSK